MRSLPAHLVNDPHVAETFTDLNRELETLRGLVEEKERTYRQAQECINNYKRDWLYTTCQNFRGTIGRMRERKARLVIRTKVTIKLGFFALGIALAPVCALMCAVGIGKRSAIEKDPSQSRLKVGLTESLPETLAVGAGNSFIVGGWAFHPDRRITQLELRLLTARPEIKPGVVVDEVNESDPLRDDLPPGQQVEFRDCKVPVMIRNIPNRRVLTDHYPDQDANGNSFWSGFHALVTVPPISRAARGQLVVRAYLDDGTIETLPLGRLTLQPKMPAPRPIGWLPGGDEPLVAVCMTTYNPPAELFRRQIDSIREQTHPRWICIIRDDGSSAAFVKMIHDTIADDPRFVFRQNSKNLGFYKNFEAVLADVPAEFDFVALADQDDRWHADKLETLLHSFTPGTTLVYSDTNIVDESGRVKATTYWTTRDNNYTHFPTLLLANTITGAASMVRRNLLDYLLPFPEKHGDAYHDHWLGCTAMALGNIRYVERPLYDYTQHAGNVVGHVAPKPSSWVGTFFRFFAFFWPPKLKRNVNAFMRHGRGYYFADLLRIQHTARNVLLRCGQETTDDKKAVLSKILTMAETWSGRLWLALRPWRRRNSWRMTVGVERNLLHAMCWRAHLKIKAWWGTRLTAHGILRDTMGRQCLPRVRIIDHIDTVAAVTRITEPLSLAIRADAPPRVNVVLSIIDFKYVFGGYITLFHLCQKLVHQGFRVRLIVTDECDFRPVTWADNFRHYPGLEEFLDRIELVYAFDRSTIVPVGPRDTFLATSWWTAHIARQAIQTLGKQRFVYLIQEYEPGFYAWGSLAAHADESYTFPHYAIFSTEILRDFFRQNRVSVFRHGDGDSTSTHFQNAITSVGTVTADDLRKKRVRKLLFYCRPEAHALRNMFDTGLIALRQAIKAGAFYGWEFHGIGSMNCDRKIKLGDDVFMQLLPRLDQEKYRKILRDYDVGLSLMHSPHPSLVPLEMAKAGMWTVTNACANKSPEKLREISTNFLPCAPTVESVRYELLHACAKVREFEARARGAAVNWATDWDQAFPPEFMDRLGAFLHATMLDQDVDALESFKRAA